MRGVSRKIPATAPKESCKLMFAIAHGLKARMTIRAKLNAVGADIRRVEVRESKEKAV